jgi:hypothetical protein
MTGRWYLVEYAGGRKNTLRLGSLAHIPVVPSGRRYQTSVGGFTAPTDAFMS